MARRSARRLRLLSLEARIAPAAFTVLNTADAGVGSLRQAILDANALAGADSIVFDAATFANPSTITLTTGQMTIADAVSINGPAAKVTIDANKASRIFNITVPVPASLAVSIGGLHLTNGNAGSADGGAINSNTGALSLSDVKISNCVTTGGGGAINGTNLTISDCVFTNNSATSSTSVGGALVLAAETVLTRCTIAGNSAGGRGGGISYIGGNDKLTIVASTLSANSASKGGALVLNGSPILIQNSTLSGNKADNGGAIYNFNALVTIQNSTIAFNTATSTGGGIYSLFSPSNTIHLGSTIIAKNSAPSARDVASKIDATYCLFGSNVSSDGNNKNNMDPLLGPLANNGGPTLTHAIPANSPCVDAGSNSAGLTNDQRGSGFPRTLGAQTDIGAFEFIPIIPQAVGSSTTVSTAGATSQSVIVTFVDDNGINVTTIATGNIVVNGPNGFATTPTLTGLDNSSNGAPRIATYTFTPPSGSWSASANGVYQVAIVNGQVFDVDAPTPHSIPASQIGMVTVSIAAPMAVATSSTVSVAGGTSHAIQVTYSDNMAIDVTSLGEGDITVSGPNGFTATPIFVGVNNATNGSPRIATYQFTPPGGAWDIQDNGKYQVTIVEGQVFNIDIPTPAAVPSGIIGSFDIAIPTTFVVTNTNVTGPGSFSQAIYDASGPNFPGADTIVFDSALVTSGGASIALTSFDAGLDSAGAGPSAFVISSSLTITGPSGPNGITIMRPAGAANFRLFHVRAGASLTIESITLTGGLAQGFTGSGGAAGMGGAVFNQGTLTMRGVTLTANKAQGAVGVSNKYGGGGGGGLGASNETSQSGGGPNGGTSGSSATSGSNGGAGGPGGFGGGGGSGGSGSNPYSGGPGGTGGFGGGGGGGGPSPFSQFGNASGGNGGFGGGGGAGSYYAFGAFAGGKSGFGGGNGKDGAGGGGAGMGGALFSNAGTINIVNCTFADNSTIGGAGGLSPQTMLPYADPGQALGGAIFIRNGSATIQNCTFANNSAAQSGGAIFAIGDAGNVTFTLDSSIIANSLAGVTDFQSTVINSGTRTFNGTANLIRNNATGGNGFTGGIVSTADPLLGPLADNGGPTKTMALLAGSPAINQGSNPNNLTTDQRGFNRVVGSAIDIGAFEVQWPPVVSNLVINGGAAQRSRVTSLQVTFDSRMTLPANPADAFHVVRQSDSATVTLAASVNNSGPTTAVMLSFTGGPVDFGSLADGRYTLTVIAPLTLDPSGQQLDGNGDGVGGDDFSVIGTPANGLFRLFGDADGDGTVNGMDFVAFRLAFLGSNNTFDFDSDGTVTGVDFLQFRLRFLQII